MDSKRYMTYTVSGMSHEALGMTYDAEWIDSTSFSIQSILILAEFLSKFDI